MKKKYIFFISLIFFIFFNLKSLFSNIVCTINLIDAVNENNIKQVQEIIKSDTTKIDRSQFEEAIYLAASKGYIEIFSLLEPFVSRQAHRRAFYKLFGN